MNRTAQRVIPTRYTKADKDRWGDAPRYCGDCAHYRAETGCVRNYSGEPIPVSSLRYACEHFAEHVTEVAHAKTVKTVKTAKTKEQSSVKSCALRPVQVDAEGNKTIRCRKCGRWLTVDHFHKWGHGYLKECNDCRPPVDFSARARHAAVTRFAGAPRKERKPKTPASPERKAILAKARAAKVAKAGGISANTQNTQNPHEGLSKAIGLLAAAVHELHTIIKTQPK